MVAGGFDHSSLDQREIFTHNLSFGNIRLVSLTGTPTPSCHEKRTIYRPQDSCAAKDKNPKKYRPARARQALSPWVASACAAGGGRNSLTPRRYRQLDVARHCP